MTEENLETQDETQDESQEDQAVEQEQEQKQQPEGEQAEHVEEQEQAKPDEDEDAKERARQEFLERQRKKTQEKLQSFQPQAKQEDKDEMEYLKRVAKQLEQQQRLNEDMQVFKQLETEFRQGIDDYDDVVNQAIEASKIRLISEGMSESQALQMLEHEKINIANNAVRMGKDPVEMVYNEARKINTWIDQLAEKRGYIKPKTKTNMAALKEASKPNAMTGGRSTGAVKKKFDEMDNPNDIAKVTLGDIMGG